MLSTTAEYALRIMIALAESEKESMTSEEIAAVTVVPPGYAVKILHTLGREGLVKGQRGRGGGFTLAIDPRETTLLDIVSSIDPPERITQCPLGREEHRHQLCPLHKRLDDLAAYMEQTLGEVTIQDVVDSSSQKTLCQPQSIDLTTSAKGKTKKRKAG